MDITTIVMIRDTIRSETRNAASSINAVNGTLARLLVGIAAAGHDDYDDYEDESVAPLGGEIEWAWRHRDGVDIGE